MALIADGLALVRAHSYTPRAFLDRRHGQVAGGYVQTGTAVKEPNRRPDDFLSGADSLPRLHHRLALAVNRMTGQARDRGSACVRGIFEPPGSGGINGLGYVLYAAFKVHAVAAETIVHQQTFAVVLTVRKDTGVGCR